MKTSCLIAALALLTATGAVAKDKQADQATAEKKICQTEHVTGSLTRVNRICMTKQEWDELAAQSRKNLDDQRTRGAIGTGASQTSGGGAG